ncbi:Histone-lysine N-methyltransferase Smyd1 [Cyphellophora attinorum]|uniref:Histone-lysine N-methyltransferase Smyd1 n=1 Tax=Cyphellophora attinorum TaxID=1664694 RepID=A0A0N0NPF7_9EURO|nr:Histone-lysine N-methyltransferase Smyd1 [Phialophora attinorum]KPI42489.1 Histone-lysine N-methyltransferase Smyd1 [Phialophora attinorum]
MFINKPISIFVAPYKFDSTCHQCFRTEQNSLHGSWKYIAIGPPGSKLKDCSNCRRVKYCSDSCEKQAWTEHHRYECSVYKSSSLEELSNENAFTDRRAALRILLQRKNGVLSGQAWKQILDLEAHVDKVLLDLIRGPRLVRDSHALQKLAGSEESISTIQRIMCVLEANKFSLSYPDMDILGKVFDPEPAMMNHNCDPNGLIRTDVSNHFSPDSSPNPIVGSISVHARKPIAKGEEICNGYVPVVYPTSIRQTNLQYGDHKTTDEQLMTMVHSVKCHKKTYAAALKLNLAALAREGSSIEEYPMAQLRSQMVIIQDLQLQSITLVEPHRTIEIEKLVVEYLVLVYRVYRSSTKVREDYNMLRWRLFCWVSILYSDTTIAQKIPEEQLQNLYTFVLDELAQDLLSPEQTQFMPWAKPLAKAGKNKDKRNPGIKTTSTTSQGLFEMMCLEHLEERKALPRSLLAKTLAVDSPMRLSLEKWIDVVTSVALAREKCLPTEGVVSGGPPYDLDPVVAHEFRKLSCLSMIECLKQMNISK